MIVYDVVQTVQPGALTSTTPGSWLVAYFRSSQAAWSHVELCNHFRAECVVGSVEYTVETHDEESSERREYEADYIRKLRKNSKQSA